VTEHGVERRSVVETLPCQIQEFSNVIGCLVGMELNSEGTRGGFDYGLQVFRVFLLRH
jgi:hypothetical protein